MPADNRILLEVLRSELKFMESGRYHPSAWAHWSPQLIFEDSPACRNFGKAKTESCTGCVFMPFVPLDHRGDRAPCRHIPLDSEGATLAAFYHYGTQESMESAVTIWLRATIANLEQHEAASQVKNANEILCLPDGKKFALCDFCSSSKAEDREPCAAVADHLN